MNPILKMNNLKSEFTKTEKHIFRIINDNVDIITRISATAFAEDYKVSQSAITRFCQKIGYSGFSEFKYALFRYLQHAPEYPSNDDKPFDYYIQFLQILNSKIIVNDIEKISNIIFDSKRIFTTGFHKSAFAAHMLDMNLKEFGYQSEFLTYDVICRFDSFCRSTDLLIIFSVSSSTYNMLNDVLASCDENSKPKILLITQTPKHPFLSYVDYKVVLPNYKSENLPHFIEHQVTAMIYVAVLTSYINKK